MTQLIRLFALVAIAAALLAAGCGDDDDDATATTSTDTAAADAVGAISLEQWTTQADRICAEGDRAQQQAAQQKFGNQPPSDEELEQFAAEVVVPNLQAQHDSIATLPMPDAEAEQIETILSALQAGIDEISQDPGLLVQGTDSVPSIAEASEMAQDIGLTDCGSG